MKTLLNLIVVSVFLNVHLSAAPVPPPPDTTFALTPWHSPKEAMAVQNDLLRFILTQAPAGVRLTFYDGWHLKSVAEFTLSDEARERRHRAELGRLLGWFQYAMHLKGPLTNTGAIDLPAVLDDFGRNSPTGAVLVTMGSPLFISRNEPKFNFVIPTDEGLRYRYPSDGLSLVEQGLSPFSVQGKEDRLKGRAVHFLYSAESLFRDSFYKDNVQRFWSLNVQLQQGETRSFSGDRARVFSTLFRPPVVQPVRHALDPRKAKPEMFHEIRQVLERAGTNHVSQMEQERRVVEAFTANAPKAPFAIGIMWSADVDLDLWVIPAKGAVPIYFGSTITSQGRHLHDYTQANEGTDYEQVVLNGSPAAEMEVYVNLYGARAALTVPVTGRVMVRHNGRTRLGTFKIEGLQGNKAANREARDTDPCWVKIEWLPLVGPEVSGNR